MESWNNTIFETRRLEDDVVHYELDGKYSIYRYRKNPTLCVLGPVAKIRHKPEAQTHGYIKRSAEREQRAHTNATRVSLSSLLDQRKSKSETHCPSLSRKTGPSSKPTSRRWASGAPSRARWRPTRHDMTRSSTNTSKYFTFIFSITLSLNLT